MSNKQSVVLVVLNYESPSSTIQNTEIDKLIEQGNS